MKKIIDYDLTISGILADIDAWLNERVPRDSTEVAEINDTKEMWEKVCKNPQLYSRYDMTCKSVCGHTNGFVVKKSVNSYDSSMMIIVFRILSAMDEYYRVSGNKQKAVLADVVKEYKMYRAKNKFERFMVSLRQPQHLLSTRQR